MPTARLSLIGSLLIAAAQSAASQPLPLAPTRVTVELLARHGESHTWKVGPVKLELPESWTDASKSHVALLAGPQDSVASFVAAEATKAATTAGYTVLNDPNRGPLAFQKLVDWSECHGSAGRAIQTATIIGGTAVMAVCPVAPREAVLGSFAQISLYSATKLVQVQVIGGHRAVEQFLKAIKEAAVAQ